MLANPEGSFSSSKEGQRSDGDGFSGTLVDKDWSGMSCIDGSSIGNGVNGGNERGGSVEGTGADHGCRSIGTVGQGCANHGGTRGVGNGCRSEEVPSHGAGNHDGEKDGDDLQ